jgi:DNA-directed RNA polymerase subunit RPC12/RpoP
MAEPTLYRCIQCLHAWQRNESVFHRNPPPVCPRCGSSRTYSRAWPHDKKLEGKA